MSAINLPTVELRSLLSTCLALTRAACEAIREVQEARQTQVISEFSQIVECMMQGSEALGAVLKDATDPRTALTLADTRAQDIIWKGLRSAGL